MIPEAIGMFTADLSGGTPQQWTLQVAHVRHLLDLEVASGTYDMEVGDVTPLELMATLYNFNFFEVGTRALNIAQRAASWLTQKALRFTKLWTVRLNDDDAVSISSTNFFRLFGGLSSSISMDWIGGKVGFSHGGLEILYFVADPEQPLDCKLSATIIRIASAKTSGEFDVQHPFVVSSTWGCGNCRLGMSTTMIAVDIGGKKMPSEENVSQLFEKLKVSPGGGLISDGTVTICLGESDGQPSSSPDDR